MVWVNKGIIDIRKEHNKLQRIEYFYYDSNQLEYFKKLVDDFCRSYPDCEIRAYFVDLHITIWRKIKTEK